MTVSLKILNLAIIFVITGGAVFADFFRRNRFLASIAAVVAIIGSYYLGDSIYRDIKNELNDEISRTREVPEISSEESCRSTFFSVRRNESLCGFSISENGEIYYRGDKISKPIEIESFSGGHITLAESLVVYPSSSNGRYFYIRACAQTRDSALTPLCWSQWTFDRQSKKINWAAAGKYGPSNNIHWSPDGRLLTLFATSDGYDQINVFDAKTGDAWSIPDWGSKTSRSMLMYMEKDSFRWTGPREFQATVKLCSGLGGRKCDWQSLERMNFKKQKFFIGAFQIALVD